MVSAGSRHTCGLRADHHSVAEVTQSPYLPDRWAIEKGNGTAACWGRNFEGQAQPPLQIQFLQLSSGSMHTCGIRAVDDTASCWGANYFNQSNPPAGVKFSQLSSGAFHTCGLERASTRAHCWGANFMFVKGNYAEGQTVVPDGVGFDGNRAALCLHEETGEPVRCDPGLGAGDPDPVHNADISPKFIFPDPSSLLSLNNAPTTPHISADHAAQADAAEAKANIGQEEYNPFTNPPVKHGGQRHGGKIGMHHVAAPTLVAGDAAAQDEDYRLAGAGLEKDSKTGTGLHPDDMDAYEKLRIGKEKIFDAIDTDVGLEGLDPIALRLITRIRHTGLHWPMMRTCTGATVANAYGHGNVTCTVDADCPLSALGRCNGRVVQTFENEPTTFDDTVAALKAWYYEKIAPGTTVASELNLRVTAANNKVREMRAAREAAG